MRKIKLIIVLCVLVICGCRYINEEKSFTLDEVEVSIINYMETKYSQEFELTDIGYSSIISKEVNACVISLEDERRNEISVYWFYENGKEVIDDDYTYLLYKKDVNEVMDLLINREFNTLEYVSYSYINASIPIEKYDSSISFSSIASNYDINIKTRILLNESALGKENEIEESIFRLYDELKKETNSDVQFHINVYICGNDNFYENKPLIQEYKELYSTDISDIPLTYYDPNHEIAKNFHFTSNDLESGVTVR